MTRSLFSTQYDQLCQLLIRARMEAGLSQAELAKCLKRPQSFVSKYETKQRRLDVVEFLEVAHCMGTSGPELLRQLASGEAPIMPTHSSVPESLIETASKQPNHHSITPGGRGDAQ